MKTIDQTPFRGQDGTISPMDRIQATLKFGTSWYGEIQAQDAAKEILGKYLARGYYLLQNAPLPGVPEVRVPLILAGPAGVFLLNVTNERGIYRAKGDAWGTMKGDSFTPAKINLIKTTMRMAAVLQKYLNSQGYEGSIKVESLLVAMNPGAHIDSVRPVVRIIMSDAFERFVISLSQAQPILSPETAQQVIERIAEPRPVKKAMPAAVAGVAPRPIAMPEAEKRPQPTPKPGTKPAPQPAKSLKAARTKKSSIDTRKWIIIGGVVFVVAVVLLIAAIFFALFLNA